MLEHFAIAPCALFNERAPFMVFRLALSSRSNTYGLESMATTPFETIWNCERYSALEHVNMGLSGRSRSPGFVISTD